MKDFGEALNLLTEIDCLLDIDLNEQLAFLQLQLHNLIIQWTVINTLIIELHLLLQFSWILQKFARVGTSFLISLLLPKNSRNRSYS